MKKLFISLITLSFLLSMTACQVNWGNAKYEVPWWIIALPVTLILIIAHLWIISRLYKCPHCHTIFHPKWYHFSSWIHVNNKRIAKCPNCSQKGFCKIEN